MTGASGKVDRNLFHPAIHNRWHIVSDLFDTRARGSERNSTLRFIQRFSFVLFFEGNGGNPRSANRTYEQGVESAADSA
jgi:hypothetical protein